MNSLVEFSTDLTGDTAVVHAAGEVDMSNAQELLNAIQGACEEISEPTPLVVDLTGITFFGSSGINVLLLANHRCEAQRTPLRVVATSRAVLLTLRICGLGGVLDIRDSLANATGVRTGPAQQPAGHENHASWPGDRCHTEENISGASSSLMSASDGDTTKPV
jgi:anti-sigma B factor antagonist